MFDDLIHIVYNSSLIVVELLVSYSPFFLYLFENPSQVLWFHFFAPNLMVVQLSGLIIRKNSLWGGRTCHQSRISTETHLQEWKMVFTKHFKIPSQILSRDL